MIEICPPEKCTGCRACQSVCGHGAISFQPDSQGFLRPVVDQQLCVDCMLCERTCPTNNPPSFSTPSSAWSGWVTDSELRLHSASGGAFSALAEPLLRAGGVVFGAALDDELKVGHIAVEIVEGLEALRGSKYVQSDTRATYSQVRDLLRSGRNVLYSGTPCQIAGLRKFLRKDYESLITVDILCHGVPSPLVFEKWKEWFMATHDAKALTSIRFREKQKSWMFYNMDVRGQHTDGSPLHYVGGYFDDAWSRGFLRNNYLRPCCYICSYARLERCSDITIADWWGYLPRRGESNDFEKKGVSMILCNTPRGKDYFDRTAAASMHLNSESVEQARKVNPPLRAPFPRPEESTQFWADFHSLPFADVVAKYMAPQRKVTLPRYIQYRTSPSPTRRIALKIYFILKRLLKLKKDIWVSLPR